MIRRRQAGSPRSIQEWYSSTQERGYGYALARDGLELAHEIADLPRVQEALGNVCILATTLDTLHACRVTRRGILSPPREYPHGQWQERDVYPLIAVPANDRVRSPMCYPSPTQRRNVARAAQYPEATATLFTPEVWPLDDIPPVQDRQHAITYAKSINIAPDYRAYSGRPHISLRKKLPGRPDRSQTLIATHEVIHEAVHLSHFVHHPIYHKEKRDRYRAITEIVAFSVNAAVSRAIAQGSPVMRERYLAAMSTAMRVDAVRHSINGSISNSHAFANIEQVIAAVKQQGIGYIFH